VDRGLVGCFAQAALEFAQCPPYNFQHCVHGFQALRIAVNGELDEIARGLRGAVERLAPGGRLAVISFHSLEDRLVKEFMRESSRDCVCPPQQPVCTCGAQPALRLVSRKAIKATDEEIAANARSRSARLRVTEKIGN